MDNRKYDKGLVAAIREKEHVEDIGGMPVDMKPIPDDDRACVLDSRVKATMERKRALFAERASERSGYSLGNERWRPDKVTYDLCEGEVTEDERLIDVDGTHQIDVFSYRGASAAKEGAPAYVFLHGGGFTSGTERIYHNQMRFLAEVSGAVVIFPDYRLAPEAPFPAAIEDCMACVRWVHDNADLLGIDTGRIMLGGDSAGGSLTCACILKDSARFIARAYLLFPGCDSSDYHKQDIYDWSWDLYPVVEGERDLVRNRIDRIRKSVGIPAEKSVYIQGKTTYEDPLVSIVYASDRQLEGFPPVTVAVSEYDYLRIGAEYFSRRLHGLGRGIRLVRYRGCDHGFLDLFGTEPQAEEVLLDMADEIHRM